MASFKTLTSEEALEDYFSALLEEEVLELISDTENNILPEPEPINWESPSATLEVVPSVQYQPQFINADNDVDDYPFELPQLEDVQRLLNQLENSQLEAQVEIDSLVFDEITTTPESAVEIKVEAEELVIDLPQVEEKEPQEVFNEDLDLSAWDISDKVNIDTSSEVTIEGLQSIIEEPHDIDTEIELEIQVGKGSPPSGLSWENAEYEEEFQVLFFEVMGVTFAVPLAQLGGIHQITELSHLIGRPDWYLGLQNNREIKIDALDTAKWIMPQSIKDEDYKEDYQYLVMLGESKWGLACNALAGTETLTSDRIRWRETAGKRPWLSGMVKEKMCALIHVEAMITMLNAGLDIKGIE